MGTYGEDTYFNPPVWEKIIMECKHEVRHQLYNAAGKKVNRCIVCGNEEELSMKISR